MRSASARVTSFGWVLAFCLLFLSSHVRADTFYWTNALGGAYSAPANWSPNGVPTDSDIILFTNVGAYDFTVDQPATNAEALFHQGSITQAIPSTTWIVTNAFRVGDLSGSSPRVTAIDGLLAVTNASGSAVLSVGGAGTGELAIRGGNVVADVVVATNGNRSILTLGHGEFTTLHGLTVSNAGKLTLGTTANGLLTWNANGGNNRIITSQFDYGGLTLGESSGGRRAKVNLTGSNTVLNVPGLDTYGHNEIHVRGGARFQTYSVQLGLQSAGVSNVVVITDPGSSWINDYLMYFGMHSGAQTMIISNGGYFRTGGTAFGDQRFTSFGQPNSTILVTGTNSWFHSDGTATLGVSWSSPVSPLNNLLLVTNGGRFWARQLTYGSTLVNLGSVSRPGNLINVADGSLWIGSLTFAVGTLRIETGSGTIDQLTMTGGTNAVLQTLGNLYVGHHGNLGAGELRIGGANTTIASLNGQLEVGGWQIGPLLGDSGNVTMTGGRAFVTNASQTATLGIGGGGNGTLHVNSGLVQADAVNVNSVAGGSGLLIVSGATSSLATQGLEVGAGGSVVVSNAATLQISNCTAPASTISVNQSTLEFTTGTPAIPASAITTTDALISYRNTGAVNLDLDDPAYLGRIQRTGRTSLQFVQATNASVASLVFRDNEASTWSRLILNGGSSALEAGSILIETNSALAATNTRATLAGNFTNHGQIKIHNSTLRFVGPVVWSETASLQGSQGVLLFTGGLHLPATDVVVPPGISVQASSITSDGGKLVINGGGIIPNEDGTVPEGLIHFQDGWVTYLDVAAAPLTPPLGLTGALGLELIRSTNAPVSAPVFASAPGGYERLRLGNGSRWQSQQLVASQGGSIFLADPSASVTLTSGVFRVEQGGLFQDDTGGTSHVGFSPNSTNSSATVSGVGSTWRTPGLMAIGAGGSQNQMLIESGGRLLANSATVGASGANNNRLILNGPDASCFATNGLTLAGSQNQFLVQTGGVFTGSQILVSGSSALVSLSGPGAVVNCSTQVVISGSSARLLMSGGASLFSSNGIVNASSGAMAELSGAGTLWKLTGGLTLNATFFPFATNRVLINEQAAVATPALTLTSSTGRAALIIQSGRLFVTNLLGSAHLIANGPLDLNGGLLRADILTAGSSSASAINLRAGRAEWKTSDFATGVSLRVGDGFGLASLNLLGGSNIFRSGLEVRRHSQLSGSGVIIGGVTNRGRFSPSTMTIQGNLVLDPTSHQTFEIAGSSGSPLNSSLVVTGAVILSGELGISIAPGYVPPSAQSFILLQAASITSNFANVSFGQRLLTTDRLASFRIDKSATTIEATDFQSEDQDGDGIQDTWAMQHFGISPLLPGTSTNNLDGDWDGDGLSNRNEFVLGFDPTDPSSGLYVQLEATGFGFLTLHFPYFPNRSHSISTSSNLSGWTDTFIEEFWFNADGKALWFDKITPDSEKRFYRLLVD